MKRERFSNSNMKRSAHGFTLVELMIGVAIVGILAAIAIPNFEQYKKKARRAAAQDVLLQISQKQVQYLQFTRTGYADSVAALNIPTSEGAFVYYDFKGGFGAAVGSILTASPPPSFTVYAIPKAAGIMAGDDWMAITNTGLRTTGQGTNSAVKGTW